MITIPFSGYYGYFSGLIDKVSQEIAVLDDEYALKASPAEVEAYFIDSMRIEPLKLRIDKMSVERQNVQIDVSKNSSRVGYPGKPLIVPGTRLIVWIPYEGDATLWLVQPSSRCPSYPEIKIKESDVALTLEFPNDRLPVDLRAEIDLKVRILQDAIQTLCHDIEQYNQSIRCAVRDALQKKRSEAQAVMCAIESTGLPLRRRDEPLSFVAPIIRRETPVRLPVVSPDPYSPEPVLEEAEYLYILRVMRSMSLIIERNPSTFGTLDEPAIRDHFLLQLNGHYEGGATGETFNAGGKTDILIRVDDRNVFIAECKFWSGSGDFGEALDQLLRYLTWRDVKCALVIFNRNKDATAVARKMHEVIEARKEHRRTVTHSTDGDSRYVLVKESEPGKEIIVTTQVYNIPSSQ